MSDADKGAMDAIAREWLEARAVIMGILKELCPGMTVEHLERNAAATIARLSHAGFAITKVDQ